MLAALRFLTVLPVSGRVSTPAEMAASLAYFPAVGLLLGLIVASADALLLTVYSERVTSALVLALLAVMTGALHLDGLADTADGLFHPGGPERRLEIMRDSRVGGFGVVTVVLVLLIQYGALTGVGGRARLPLLLLTPCQGRWAQTLAIAWFPYGRPDGRGTPFHAEGKERRVLVASLFTALVTGLLVGMAAVPVLLAVAAAVWLLGRLVLRQVPGLTGDTYGAITELVQTLVLLVLTAGG